MTSFYRFLAIPPDRLSSLQARLEAWMTENAVLGLVLLAEEGINGTVAGDLPSIESFKALVRNWLELPQLHFKDSACSSAPFKRVTVSLRQEIVGLKRPDLVPLAETADSLSPSEWQALLESDQPKVLIDTRNKYETSLGMFQGAIDPGMDRFSDWSGYLETAELPKEATVMIYCTGGIRCEKAILEMKEKGFEKVYQLRGGILDYLAEFPNEKFKGECFVFDDRVSVGQDLQPTGKFGICPGCGLTSSKKVVCGWCQEEFFLCEKCGENRGCSKTCDDRIRRHGPRVLAGS